MRHTNPIEFVGKFSREFVVKESNMKMVFAEVLAALQRALHKLPDVELLHVIVRFEPAPTHSEDTAGALRE